MKEIEENAHMGTSSFHALVFLSLSVTHLLGSAQWNCDCPGFTICISFSKLGRVCYSYFRWGGGVIQLMSLAYFLEDTFPFKNYGFGTHFEQPVLNHCVWHELF